MVEWVISKDICPYLATISAMERRVRAIIEGNADEAIWLLEHPSLYSAGLSAKADDLLAPARFEVFKTNRGGQYTYHGPGQRIVYVMLDLRKYGRDVHKFLRMLEQWIIATLARFEIEAHACAERTGVWVGRPEKPPLRTGEAREDKIAAIGIRVKKWVSLHGFSLNHSPALEHFSGIVPCGIEGHGVTSLSALGVDVPMAALDAALRADFQEIFKPTALVASPLRTVL